LTAANVLRVAICADAPGGASFPLSPFALQRMNVLPIYPRNPDTFWSFQRVLRFVSKKSAFPPLGLLTVAAMLPPS